MPPLDCGKVSALTAATDARFLTVTLVFCGACAACGGFRRLRNTAATFHILYRLQVTKFSLLKSAPNGVNYIDIPGLLLHANSFVTTCPSGCSTDTLRARVLIDKHCLNRRASRNSPPVSVPAD